MTKLRQIQKMRIKLDVRERESHKKYRSEEATKSIEVKFLHGFSLVHEDRQNKQGPMPI